MRQSIKRIIKQFEPSNKYILTIDYYDIRELIKYINEQEKLIKNQQKEIDKLHTITQNYDVIDGFTGNDNRIIVCDRKYIIDGTFKRNYIFKSKIRAKIKELEKESFKTIAISEKINVLKELLEE